MSFRAGSSPSTSPAPWRWGSSPGSPSTGALTIIVGGGIGSYTTFSTWILDSHRLAVARRADLAWLNIGVAILAGFAAVTIGHWVGTGF